MNDATPIRPLSATERGRLLRFDQIAARLCYMAVAILYVSGALLAFALVREILNENGPMATVYLAVAAALFGAGERLRRSTRLIRQRPGRSATYVQ